jgi:uncharacterized protein (TIGR03435 family)
VRLLRIGSLLVVATGLVSSQKSTPSSPTQFEAVSIRPNKSGDGFTGIEPSPRGRLVANNVSLKMLIAWAYQVRNSQISNAPNWADSAGFDVVAKAEGNPRFDRFQPTLEAMFRGVLVERFKLVLHRERKKLPIYRLLVSKKGPKLHQVSETDDSECLEHPSLEKHCGQVLLPRPGQLTGQKASMRAFVAVLSLLLDQTVVDQTSLTGSYDFKLAWQQDGGPRAPVGSPAAPLPATDRRNVAEDLSGAMAPALDDQLGLKLQSSRGRVEILVVDHAERPSEN